MYTIRIGNKEMEFKTKEELIRDLVNKEQIWRIDPKTYVPSVFREVAMNPNDRRTVVDLGGDFMSWLRDPEKVQRAVMVYDDDNRIIDIRTWLPEFRTAMEERISNTSKYVWFGCSGTKPKFRNAYRIGKGQKQRQSLHEQVDREEVAQVMSSAPAKMLRKYKADSNIRMRDNPKSWKNQSKCCKSWQCRSGQPSARELHKTDWQEEMGFIEETLTAELLQDDELLQFG